MKTCIHCGKGCKTGMHGVNVCAKCSRKTPLTNAAVDRFHDWGDSNRWVAMINHARALEHALIKIRSITKFQ